MEWTELRVKTKEKAEKKNKQNPASAGFQTEDFWGLLGECDNHFVTETLISS